MRILNRILLKVILQFFLVRPLFLPLKLIQWFASSSVRRPEEVKHDSNNDNCGDNYDNKHNIKRLFHGFFRRLEADRTGLGVELRYEIFHLIKDYLSIHIILLVEIIFCLVYL